MSRFYQAIAKSIQDRMWAQAGDHFDGKGLESGADLSVLKKHLNSLEKKNKMDKHKALSDVLQLVQYMAAYQHRHTAPTQPDDQLTDLVPRDRIQPIEGLIQ